ncbi:MAG: homoserine dehydrogenase [Deltaproteobacteria bacterium]|nr:homoserine dehydrogenase [Deltaproteobacteria bacterium]
MKETKIGIIGWGTVGSGTAKILLEEQDLIRRKVGCPVILKKIADLDLERSRPVSVPREILTTDAGEILNDPEIQVVVELMGGYEPARSFILQAIKAGKHVVTANKALLATHGPEIFDAAEQARVDILFEASVGGGIPLIRGLKEGLAANHIQRFFGILNGTSNYILTKMTKENLDFNQALAEAQAKGFAEADPTFDVEGIDAAHKLVILVGLAYGLRVTLDQVYVEGISRIAPLDIQFADEFGYVIKLLAISSQEAGLVEARLHPTMLPKGHLMAEVNGPFNAVHVHGHAVGDVLFFGAGAGMMPTASAVVSDIMELARGIHGQAPCRVPAYGWRTTTNRELSLRSMDQVTSPYYFRFSALDQPGVLSKISGILGKHDISIAAVNQKGRQVAGAVPVVMLTHEAKEASVRAALSELDGLEVLRSKTVIIRVEDRL